jgi:UV DNA damage endonuclease
MNLKLGLVCISEELRKRKIGAYKAMTRKSFLSADRQKSLQILSQRTLQNAMYLHDLASHIHNTRDLHRGSLCHLRISSNVFPLITDPTLGLCYDDLPDIEEIQKALSEFGKRACEYGISLSSHPDQYNVLGSYRPDVVEKSIHELNHQSCVMDMIGLPRDVRAPMTLHVACSPRFKDESLNGYHDRFMTNFDKCDSGVRNRLVLENEDKGYWNCENLYNTFVGFSLVYDNLHDACNPSEDDADYATLFKKTWCGFTPVYHWSEGVDNTNKHCRRASHVPDIVKKHHDVIWEVELKDKDTAIFEICNLQSS